MKLSNIEVMFFHQGTPNRLKVLWFSNLYHIFNFAKLKDADTTSVLDKIGEVWPQFVPARLVFRFQEVFTLVSCECTSFSFLEIVRDMYTKDCLKVRISILWPSFYYLYEILD